MFPDGLQVAPFRLIQHPSLLLDERPGLGDAPLNQVGLECEFLVCHQIDLRFKV